MKSRSLTCNALSGVVAALGLMLSIGAQAAGESAVSDSDATPPALASGTGERNAPENEADGAQSRRIEPPVVRTRREHGQTITEYERRGGVYMMTVKPRSGPTQYWNDPDGDGRFQGSTSDDVDEDLNLPKWRLGGW